MIPRLFSSAHRALRHPLRHEYQSLSLVPLRISLYPLRLAIFGAARSTPCCVDKNITSADDCAGAAHTSLTTSCLGVLFMPPPPPTTDTAVSLSSSSVRTSRTSTRPSKRARNETADHADPAEIATAAPASASGGGASKQQTHQQQREQQQPINEADMEAEGSTISAGGAGAWQRFSPA